MGKYIIFIGLALFVWSCQGAKTGEVAPADLLMDLNDPGRLIPVDEIAQRIIEDDPTLLLIDVRPEASFRYFSLPGAIHIPIDELLSAAGQGQLDDEKYDMVFLSNDGVLAEQAWLLNRRLGHQHLFLMEGGINSWAENILNPEVPPASASAADWEQYRFRKAAGQYFIGQSTELEPEPFVRKVQVSNHPKTIKVKPKKKVKEEEEGC